MRITKCRDFCKRMIQKFSFKKKKKAFRINRFANLVIQKQLLEPKLVNTVRPSHSSVAPRLLGFHRIPKSVAPISYSRSDRVSLVQWQKPDRWDRVFQLGGSEVVSRKPNPKIFELNLIYERFDWIEVFQSWQES